jgi:prefoldin beta subunit
MEREELEKLTVTYQRLQAQLQSLGMQKEQFRAQKEECTEALAELEKAKGKIYAAKGGIIVESNREEAMKELKEKQESAEMRHTIATKQYDESAKKEKELRAKITEALKNQELK